MDSQELTQKKGAAPTTPSNQNLTKGSVMDSVANRGDRVRDKISDETGTAKDHFMNQVIVRWDAPDENGNRVSSVPASDLEHME